MAQQSTPTAEGNPRAASTRIGSCTAKTLAGQIRHDLRRGPQPNYVDASRAGLNRVLIEPASPAQMRAICEERRATRDTKRSIKSNSAVATRGVITFGAEAAQMFDRLSTKDQDRAFRLLTRLIARRLATSVHGLVVHLDETTIHAHYQLAAYNRYGQPISKTTSPSVLSELQDLTALVMQRFCPDIERGTRYGDRLAAGADFADTLHKSVRELHRSLPADLEAKRAALADLAKAETDAAARVDEMQARVDKLAEKSERSEKESKRLEIYEKRLADRVAELELAEAASETARIEAERLARFARLARDDEENRAKTIRADLAVDQSQIQKEKVDLAKKTEKLMTDIAEVVSLRDQLRAVLMRVGRWLKFGNLTQEVQAEGMQLLHDGAKIIKEVSAEEPPEEPETGPSGPGF